MRNEVSVRSKMFTDHIISEGEHDSWLASLESDGSRCVWVIMLRAKPVGLVTLSNINRVHFTADWAFYLTSNQQGSGLGAIIEFILLEHVFSQEHLQKLNCEVLETNPGVIRMHAKFGFQLEGIRRKSIQRGDDRFDVHLLGITADEWLGKRDTMYELASRAYRSLRRAGEKT
jgi:UDP-4-amino-4,6-dideoxy-N-acetyl-beta-L-altrosamine N-acetyltransferase